jgi:sec-independent protein translocase protein TatB
VNANLTLSEILTISVIVLIVFGPHRLPDLARRAGILVGKLRQAASNIRQELASETEDLAKPLADIERDLRAAKEDLKAAIPRLDTLSSPTARPRPPVSPDEPGEGQAAASDPPPPEPPVTA